MPIFRPLSPLVEATLRFRLGNQTGMIVRHYQPSAPPDGTPNLTAFSNLVFTTFTESLTAVLHVGDTFESVSSRWLLPNDIEDPYVSTIFPVSGDGGEANASDALCVQVLVGGRSSDPTRKGRVYAPVTSQAPMVNGMFTPPGLFWPGLGDALRQPLVLGAGVTLIPVVWSRTRNTTTPIERTRLVLGPARQVRRRSRFRPQRG